MNELLTKGIGHTKFKDSELGRIHEGWMTKNFAEIASNRRSKFQPKRVYINDGTGASLFIATKPLLWRTH